MDAIEVDMLGCAAKIAGDYLDDTTAALEYANRAAAVNPGALILVKAYEAAGETYNPLGHDDIFADRDGAPSPGTTPDPADSPSTGSAPAPMSPPDGCCS